MDTSSMSISYKAYEAVTRKSSLLKCQTKFKEEGCLCLAKKIGHSSTSDDPVEKFKNAL